MEILWSSLWQKVKQLHSKKLDVGDLQLAGCEEEFMEPWAEGSAYFLRLSIFRPQQHLANFVMEKVLGQSRPVNEINSRA